ncbi:MAG: NYN domain-containing protein [Christensenellales bacterium]|jgi:predicted RNA-binding protein with PIN domain
MTLIIDGYNIIGAWPDFKTSINLQDSRDRLIEIMCDYAGYTGDRVIIVFDAYAGENPKRTVENIAGVEVVYTKAGETADHYIERLVDKLCRNLSKQIEVRVATSDAIEQSIVMGRGAARVSSPELRGMVMQARSQGRSVHKNSGKLGLDSKLPADILAKLEQIRRSM